jgi:uncharacterized protein (DUF433 family)
MEYGYVLNKIVLRDSDVMHGEPIFRGTRVPVVTLVDYLEDGYSIQDFREEFPGVTKEQVQAALQIFRKALLSY